MKLLWINPSFMDYRVPLYKNIKEKLHGHFNLIFSKSRVPERCVKRIEEALNENAISIKHERILTLGTYNEFANRGIKIPITKGLYKLIKKSKPDIIIAEGFFQFTPWAVLYSFLHRIPLLIAYERTAHTERNCPFWRRWYRRFIGLFVNGYIANGTLTKEYLISQGAKAENIFTGGMCADSNGLRKATESLSKEEKQSLRNELNLSDKGLTYIFVGRLIKLKGVQYLLDAWKQHILKFPNDRLLIVGDGELREEFEKISIENPSISILGSINYGIIYKYYAISDVFIIPTLEDNWSLVVPEAMACGLPIACSIYNGCHPELVKKDVNGTTFDPLNENSILETLQYFHNVYLKDMGRNSICIESKFSPENTAENIINAITNIYERK